MHNPYTTYAYTVAYGFTTAASEFGVRPVAQRRFGAGFAAAKEHPLIGLCGIFHRGKIASFVAFVAKRLF